MEFPGNSHNVTNTNKPAKEPKEKVKIEKVVTGDVVKRSRSISKRLKSIFFGGDVKSAARYITADVLLPAVRNLIVDTTSKGIERVIYGESAASRRRPMESNRSRYSYQTPVDRYRPRAYLPDQPPLPAVTSHKRHDAGEIILSSRAEADLVVERLIDIIDTYDTASVADLNDLLGLATTHVDNKWGWSALPSVDIRQIREGYLIELPPVEPL